jgi:putative ABC transport system substrate-binding protein
MTRRHALLFAVALLAALGLLAPGGSQGAERLKIGVLLSTDEPRYTDAAEAAIKQLRVEGYDDNKITIETKSANGDKAAAAKIAKQFAANGVRLVLALGTTATAAAIEYQKDIPIVFGTVWDPVEAGFVRSWAAPGTNVTGSSNKVPMASVVRTVKLLGPMQRLGVLFNPAEKNSIFQLDELKVLQRELAFEVVEVPVVKKEEAVAVTRAFAPRVQAFYVSGAVSVTSQMAAVVAVAEAHKLPTVSHLIDTVEAGVLLGVSANLQEVGRLAGVKAAQILRGANPATIPIDTVKRFDVAINMKTATATGVKIPVDLLQTATRVIR